MEDASMTSENVTEPGSVESAEPQSARSVDDQLIDELVGRAQAEGLQLTGECGLLQQLVSSARSSASLSRRLLGRARRRRVRRCGVVTGRSPSAQPWVM
jgi:hypothetical protein